jgi:hypothetical protein
MKDTWTFISAHPTSHERQVAKTASLAAGICDPSPGWLPYRLQTDATFADG